MNEEEQYYIDLKNHRIKAHIDALKYDGCRIDSKGRVCYMVPTSTRRSGYMVIPEKTIKKLIKNGDINQSDFDKIR